MHFHQSTYGHYSATVLIILMCFCTYASKNVMSISPSVCVTVLRQTNLNILKGIPKTRDEAVLFSTENIPTPPPPLFPFPCLVFCALTLSHSTKQDFSLNYIYFCKPFTFHPIFSHPPVYPHKRWIDFNHIFCYYTSRSFQNFKIQWQFPYCLLCQSTCRLLLSQQ